jgi:aspartate aminotransferase-like enzyme
VYVLDVTAGGFMYHATMPTDALVTFRDVMLETKQFGFAQAAESAWELGGLVRKSMCEEKGLVSVAAPGFEAPGVVVVHTSDSAIPGKFIKAGTQIAAGVPFMIGEPVTRTRAARPHRAPPRAHAARAAVLVAVTRVASHTRSDWT